jgi:hypothetical protein
MIWYGTQYRSKTFDLTVVNPTITAGASLHSIQIGATAALVTEQFGNPRLTITASTGETWQLYYSANHTNFRAVAFIGGRVAAVFSMAPAVAQQLRSSTGALITVEQANALSGIGATSYTDPGNASEQYAIMLFDTTSVINTSRTLQAEGQEQLLYELINAFRVVNSRAVLEWAPRLGASARTHSANAGVGNLQQRVTGTGYDANRFVGGSTVSDAIDAFDAFNMIVRDTTGTTPMRTAILQNNLTLFGAGFSGGHTGAVRTYFTYALGNAVAVAGVTARVDNTNVTTVNVGIGADATTSVALIMTPTGYNETFTITSSNTSRITISGISTTATTSAATFTVTGLTAGSADIIVTGNCSGNRFEIPVVVGTQTGNNLTLSTSVTGTTHTLSTSTNVAANASPTVTANRVLVMGTGDSLTINATTSAGAVVEWSRTSGAASNATVTRNANNNGTVTAGSSAGTVTIRARVATGNTGFITHNITIHVITASELSFSPQSPIAIGASTTGTVTLGLSGVPTAAGRTPTYSWSSTGNQLTRTSGNPQTNTATFRGDQNGSSTVTLTATWSGTTSGSSLGRISKQATMTVQGSSFATGLSASITNVTLVEGTSSSTISITTIPATTSPTPTFTWSSSNPAVATVPSGGSNASGSNGVITAVSEGTALITVRIVQAGNPNPPEVLIAVTVTKAPVTHPSISIVGANEIPLAQLSQQYSVTPAAAMTGLYMIVWTYVGSGAIINQNTGLLTLNGDAEAGQGGTVSATLWYNDGTGLAPTGISATLAITLIE